MPGATSAEPQQVLMYRYITEFTITFHCLQNKYLYIFKKPAILTFIYKLCIIN